MRRPWIVVHEHLLSWMCATPRHMQAYLRSFATQPAVFSVCLSRMRQSRIRGNRTSQNKTKNKANLSECTYERQAYALQQQQQQLVRLLNNSKSATVKFHLKVDSARGENARSGTRIRRTRGKQYFRVSPRTLPRHTVRHSREFVSAPKYCSICSNSMRGHVWNTYGWFYMIKNGIQLSHPLQSPRALMLLQLSYLHILLLFLQITHYNYALLCRHRLLSRRES